MITCLSPSKRNGAESLLSCKYSRDMAKLQNEPKQQPSIPYATMVKDIEDDLAKSRKIAEGGVLENIKQNEWQKC